MAQLRAIGHYVGIVFRLDYVSCLLTIVSTILVGRRMWQGWIVAGANSAIICVIGLRTTQLGFIPANLFCIALYALNLKRWKHVPALSNETAALVQGQGVQD